MKIIKIAFLFLTSVSFAQDGYWDNQRVTNKEIKLSAGERVLIKSEDFPDGTTEFVYRITLLDENQKMVSDLSSLLKAIPDPTGIAQGTGGAISLTSKISGDDKCTYAIFSDNNKATDFTKTGNIKRSCLYQNNPINKEVKVISLNESTCLADDSKTIWFGFESKNWILGQKIILEIVPWVDTKASRIWSQTNKKTALNFIKTTGIASKLPNSDAFCFNIIEKLQNEYRFSVFQKLSKTEKLSLINKFEDKALIETNTVEVYNKIIRQEAKTLSKQGKYDDAITLLNHKIINKGKSSVLDYNTLGELYIYTKQFEKALKTLNIAENLDSSELLVQLNLAHTYMFLDKMSESREIHNKYKEQNVSTNQTWKNKTINDLDKFQKANLPNDNFKKILRLVD
ncbi:tetratricopeptide repeat protein [Flavobacterium sp.]|uniref:tetratricopeptide repeat protein n=1 Tax=Flavobacterium sp. TaxID=239 RepID=UPI003753B63D